MGSTSLVIVHYPVLDKRGDIVSTSINNLEMHDVARSCMTFGVELCYIVTPFGPAEGDSGAAYRPLARRIRAAVQS